MTRSLATDSQSRASYWRTFDSHRNTASSFSVWWGNMSNADRKHKYFNEVIFTCIVQKAHSL